MIETDESRYKRRLNDLVHKAQVAKKVELDRFRLPPIEKGWVRGRAVNIRQAEEACEYGILQILDFDVDAGTGEPPIPVRMTGTDFTNRLVEGHVMDVPDPTPEVRPITPRQIFYSHSNRNTDLKSYYPGQDALTKRAGAINGVLAIGGPVVALIASLLVLHFVAHVF